MNTKKIENKVRIALDVFGLNVPGKGLVINLPGGHQTYYSTYRNTPHGFVDLDII